MATLREILNEKWRQSLETLKNVKREDAVLTIREVLGFLMGLFLLRWLYRHSYIPLVPPTHFWVLVSIPGIVGLLYHFVSIQSRYRSRQSTVTRYLDFVKEHDQGWHDEWARRIRTAFGPNAPAPTKPSKNPLTTFDVASYTPSAAAALWAAILLTGVFSVAAMVAYYVDHRPIHGQLHGFPTLIGQKEIDSPTSDVESAVTDTTATGTAETPAGTTATTSTAAPGSSASAPTEEEKKLWKEKITSNATNGFLFAALGAYVSVLWRMMSRINANALTYRFMFTAALRSAIAMIVGLAAGQLDLFGFLKTNGPREVVFFLVGLFTDWAIGALRIRARGVFQQADPGCERLPLCLVDGLDDGVIDILDEIGIWDVQHLATIDPGELTMRTLYPFNRVLDWIDQAILISSLRQNIKVARDLGIRGAIDVMSLYSYTRKAGTPATGTPPATGTDPRALAGHAEAVLKAFADKSGMNESAVQILAAAFWFDYTVNLLYGMWQRVTDGTVKGGSAVP